MFKRFVVEAYNDYYPCGGFEDFQGAFDTEDEAKSWIDAQIANGEWCWDRWRIVDICYTELCGCNKFQREENNIFNTIEYSTILSFYNIRKAERSKAFLMNHINEGILILMEHERPLIELKAYCIHPIVQNNEDIDVSWSESYSLAIEYRDIANSYLCRPENDYIKTLDDMKNKIKPMSMCCAYNLLADKLQNQKDFRLYHLGTHRRSNQLEQYFINWINYLEFIIKNKEGHKNEMDNSE